jgi:hypothetical protein
MARDVQAVLRSALGNLSEREKSRIGVPRVALDLFEFEVAPLSLQHQQTATLQLWPSRERRRSSNKRRA